MTTVWRNFKFFEAELLKGPMSRMEITSCCYGHKAIFVGDGEGYVYSVDRGGKGPTQEFPAYKGAVTHMKHLRSRNALVTIGDDDALNTCILRVWNLDSKPDATTKAPSCREHRLFDAQRPPPSESMQLRINYNAKLMESLKFRGRPPAESSGTSAAGGMHAKNHSSNSNSANDISVTAFRTVVVDFDVSEDLQNAAVALVNNGIVLLRGDLEHDTAVKLRHLRSGVPRGRIAFVGFPNAQFAPRATPGLQVFGLGAGAAAAAAVHAMYVVYADAVTVWQIAGAGECTEHRCEPPLGAAPGCCALTEDGQLVVAVTASAQVVVFGSEAILSRAARASAELQKFDPTLFGAVRFTEVEGIKRCVVAHRGYVVILTENESRPEKFTLQCYDLQNRLRCLSRSQESHTNCAWVIADSTDVLVISQEANNDAFVSQKVLRLTETDMQSKLEQLFQKECFDVAKRIAKRLQGTGSTQQMNIQKRYGDYLYTKGKYAEAVDQYMEAIGFLEPSYVIRRFINGQHTMHLTRFLEELHHKKYGNIANRSHTTLLLNCYTKLRDESKLSAFIRRDDIHFDAHNAIRVCRQAGYYDAAIFLAEKYAQPHDYVSIQLENLHCPLKALAFIESLCVDDAETILRAVGKDLVGLEPRRCTEIVTELCVQWRGPARRLGANASHALSARRSEARDFMHIFVDSPVCLLYFLRAVVESGVLEDSDVEAQQVVYNTLFELYITRELKHNIRHASSSNSNDNNSANNNNNNNKSIVSVPEGTAAAACEGPARGGGGGDSAALSVDPLPRRLAQAAAFLATHAGRYDDYHALALAQQHDFEEGVLFLLRRLHLAGDVLQHYAARLEAGAAPAARRAATEKLIETCREQQQQQQQQQEGGDAAARELWVSLLSLLARSPGAEWQDIAQVLECAGEQGLPSPLAVVSILAASPTLQLRAVREYALRMLRRDAQRAEALRRVADARLQRLRELRAEADALQSRAVVFQAHKCSHCLAPLDLPSVHFLCQHSFHQRCLSDAAECNACGPANRRRAAERRAAEERAADPAAFFQRLTACGGADGFSVVAEQFAKGVMGAPLMRGEATLFTGDPMAREGGVDSEWPSDAASSDEDGAVYDDDGELLRPEAVELW